MGWNIAPTGTVTVNEVVVPAVTVALTVPKYTMLLAGLESKPVPVITTVVPAGPEVGANEVIAGGGNQVNPERVSPPPGFVTATPPEEPAPTIAVMLVEELTVNESVLIPPTLTAVAPVKEVPEIVRTVP